ncbi:M10 family metallopeptidase C-terminal domain-containing protein [Pseudophaeobacter sp.]|uniref:M10 family metallopeptidase C-terminal domain-containing protein n=1 Tax=Pseudophaeobacter sp. TaxID=1971739 RepID=UPI003299A676
MCEMCGNRSHSLFEEGTTYDTSVEATHAPKPTNTVDQIADYLTTGFWQDYGGSTRSFAESSGDSLTVNLTGLTASAKAVARQALETWESVSGLRFVESTLYFADIKFDDADPSGAYAQSTVFGNGDIFQSTINIPTFWAINPDYYLQTYIHEIGHALGLGHGGAYNYDPNNPTTYENSAEYTNDSWQMSIMSYFSQTEATGVDADFAYVATPQIADIAAIQNLYGVPTNVETGNTTYGDGNTTGRDIMDMDHGYAFTIVDSGGIDTIDLGTRSYNQNLSLVVDTFSDINGKTGNFAIGRGTVIENAITGSGNDTLTGNAANNELNSGSGNDLVTGGAGEDTILGAAGSDTLYGESGSDTLNGGSGNDSLYGESGNDTLDGGSGNDTLRGGAGDDVYYVDSTSDRIFEKSGKGFDHVFASASYSLSANSDNLEDLTLTGSDNTYGIGNWRDNTITGNSGDNVINAGWGHDELVGGAGNDKLVGGAGNDTMVGGTGNDTYHVNTIGDTISEQAGEGTDLVLSKIGLSLSDYSENVENLTLTGTGNISGTGNSQNNLINGNGGNNILNGAGGDDTLYGGAGNDLFQDDSGADLMAGGTGNDTYYVDHIGDRIVERSNRGQDHVISTVDFSLAAHSDHIESLTLSGTGSNPDGNGIGSISGTGNLQDNIIFASDDAHSHLNGGMGNDTLVGRSQDDWLTGGQGADRMAGRLGNDVYEVDNIGDRIIEHAGQGEDLVNSSISFSLADSAQHVENLTLTGTADINGTGNWHDNIITGNDGDNVLAGGWGDDTMIGGAGNDTINGNGDNDQMSGGADADTFVFSGNFGVDRIVDFDVNEVGEVISLAGVSGITDYADLVANHLTEVDGEARISDGNGNSIALTGVTIADLTADDFLF